MIEMIEDYVRRAKYPTLTIEKVVEDIKNGLRVILDDGFLVLSVSQDELHVVHCYVKPGKAELFKTFIDITDKAARHFKCRVILFTTVRPKGMGAILGPYGYKPIPAVIFGREVDYE